YDDAGYLSQVTAATGAATTYEHSSDGRSLTVSVASKGQPKTTIFTAKFDNAGRVVTATLPHQGSYTFAYDVAGNQITSALITTPEGKKLRVEYYDDGSFEAHTEK